MPQPNHLLLGTRKGLVVYKYDGQNWLYQNLHFKGIPVSLIYVDDRHGTWWACLDHGHWGVKLHRSNDQGVNWEEVDAPKFPEGTMIKDDLLAHTRYIWAMAHGGKDHPDDLWIGTDPGGLFLSQDRGNSWKLVESLWNHPSRKDWFGGGRDQPGIHSIVLDPNDDNHLYIGISCAGVFETKDRAANWTILNQGLRADFLPDPYAEVGHDPHLLVACKSQPDIMWQQNHCGIFKSTDAALNWQDVSEKDGPAYFGFAMAVDDVNPNQAWVVPSISDEIRVAIDQSLCVCRTDDGGQSWKALRNGLPQEAAFDIVYRHALAAHGDHVVFGTTCGNIFCSNDRGDSWQALNNYLAMVYSVTII